MNLNAQGWKRPQVIYRWTLVVWAVAAVGHLLWFVIEGRSLLTDELYARDFLFQTAAFAFFRFPYWIGGLMVALILEFAIFRIKAR